MHIQGSGLSEPGGGGVYKQPMRAFVIYVVYVHGGGGDHLIRSPAEIEAAKVLIGRKQRYLITALTSGGP